MPLPIAILIALSLTTVPAKFGLTQLLGAHPIWAFQIALIGAPVGAALAILLIRLRIPRTAVAVLWAALTLVAFALAALGKSRFAASYAEDAFAGQLWYFGWIITAACVTALMATGLLKPPSPNT